MLRFEDTDRARSTDGAIDQALRVLAGSASTGTTGRTGRPSGSGSTRRGARLIDERRGLPCYCTAEELADGARGGAGRRPPLIYSGRCRSLTADEREAPRRGRGPHVIRLAMPADGHDAPSRTSSAAPSEWENALLGDHVIFRSDGTPDVPVRQPVRRHRHGGHARSIRGEDLLPSTPRQLALYDALGAEPPTYAHLPMVLGTDKKKLSKRHGAVSVEEFRDRGSCRRRSSTTWRSSGWSFDDHTTFMTRAELVERFTLERVNSKLRRCSTPEKLEWLNGEHLRALPRRPVTPRIARALPHSGSPLLATQPERVAEAAPMVQEKLRDAGRVRGLRRIPVRGRSRWIPTRGRRSRPTPTRARSLAAAARARSRASTRWDAEAIEAALRAACEERRAEAACAVHAGAGRDREDGGAGAVSRASSCARPRGVAGAHRDRAQESGG